MKSMPKHLKKYWLIQEKASADNPRVFSFLAGPIQGEENLWRNTTSLSLIPYYATLIVSIF